MKLKGLVEMIVAKNHDEPDYEGPRDLRLVRAVFIGCIVFWIIVAIGVYKCVS